MSTHAETTLRPTIPGWARVALALLAAGGIVILATTRPSLPWLPWQPVQPTLDDLIRQIIVCLAWLALAGICLRLALLAIKPPRRLEAVTYAPPPWLPKPRQRRRSAQREDAGELLRLFVRPKTVTEGETPAAIESTLFGAAEDANHAVGSLERLSVSLFGRLRIGGIDGDAPRERATRGLIAYLLLKRAPATMDELVEALWPGENPAKTRQRLWKAKRQAQKLLGDALIRQHDAYTLDHGRIRTDLDDLDELLTTNPLEADRLERLVELTEAEPLADVDYTWADGERRRLHAIQGELLAKLAEARLAAGDAAKALAAAERLRQLDPLNERGWCLAMEADGALGNRQAILDRYDRLTRELDERLGLKPSAEAKETYRRLLSQT